MSETVYIETSILGYLTARSTDNLILAANMKITQDWWNIRRNSFVLYASEIVEDEAARGDAAIAAQRLNLLQSLPFLDLTEETRELAQEFLQQSNLPPKASNDALHIALATVYGLDYLLTWNCKHMANAQIQKKLSQISSELGYELPIICTPYELMGYDIVGE
ncbi:MULTISPECIES: PIN domain-containing protein [unclassified Nostoc]|uniref:type II toxin-antitoxin system VapC family toxin n=1 Tax=unclassified Nostoc TaxID=2593658 RepID=UPI001689E2AC|nr:MULTISPECIES: PIN domain-containing protein [unclassified Nostoc]MBD2297259.1 type II toxin-antitoxin system VapC family toxin [Nostoc sp. FACHB-190]MBD2438043.1 type II toxin-antitoxin system VapC family toxin [Nostoc sp. FACHB-110]